MNETTSDRVEPFGCTLADLLFLTLGVSIAASLRWYSVSIESNSISGRLAPDWYRWGNLVIEMIQKGGGCLVPVILYRRWRYGGPIRPIEYLCLMLAFTQISHSTSYWPIFGLRYRDPQYPQSTLVNMEVYQVWELSQLTIGALAALLVMIWRRKPIDWFMGLLIAIAWNRLAESSGFIYQQWANDQVLSHHWPSTTVLLLSTFLVQGPLRLVAYLPLAISVVDLIRASCVRRSWVEWTAYLLMLPLPLAAELLYYARRMIASEPFDLGYIMYLSTQIMTFGLAYLLARTFEPDWRRLLGLGTIELSENPEGDAENGGLESR